MMSLLIYNSLGLSVSVRPSRFVLLNKLILPSQIFASKPKNLNIILFCVAPETVEASGKMDPRMQREPLTSTLVMGSWTTAAITVAWRQIWANG